MKQSYPVFIFDTRDGCKHPFLAYIPDLDILTEGDSLEDVIEMARDAIGVAGVFMEEKYGIPISSNDEIAMKKAKQNIDTIDFSKGILKRIDIDFYEYKKKLS